MSITTHAPEPHHTPAAAAASGGALAFPSSAHPEDVHEHEHAPEYWDGRSARRPVHRTVRRKKSSFDLRHVFKTGGSVPNAPHATNVFVL